MKSLVKAVLHLSVFFLHLSKSAMTWGSERQWFAQLQGNVTEKDQNVTDSHREKEGSSPTVYALLYCFIYLKNYKGLPQRTLKSQTEDPARN